MEFVHESSGLVGWDWSLAVWASGFGVGGLGSVGRGLCRRVWSWWARLPYVRPSSGCEWWLGRRGWLVGVGRSGCVHEGLESVGWGWSVVDSALGVWGG